MTVLKTGSSPDSLNRRIIAKAKDLCGGSVAGSKIAVLGVTRKPHTDDMREAPSLTIVPALIGAGAEVHVVDPQGHREGEEHLPEDVWDVDVNSADSGADLLIVLTKWDKFRALDLRQVAQAVKTPRMEDLRNIYSSEITRGAGFVASTGVGG